MSSASTIDERTPLVLSACIVLSGMATTFICLLMDVFLLSMMLFTDAVAFAWAATVPGSINLTHYISLAGFLS